MSSNRNSKRKNLGSVNSIKISAEGSVGKTASHHSKEEPINPIASAIVENLVEPLNLNAMRESADEPFSYGGGPP